MQAHQYIQTLLTALDNKEIPETGLLYAEKLFEQNWNYSWQSVKQVDEFCHFIKMQDVSLESIQTQTQGRNLLVLLAAYLAEVISRHIGLQLTWSVSGENDKQIEEGGHRGDFSQSLIVIIHEKSINPLEVIIKSLQSKNEANHCYIYIQMIAELLKENLDINDWSYICVNKITHHEPVFGGNFYHDYLAKIKLDFSLSSIQKIDVLLMLIAAHEELNEAKFQNQFLTVPEKKNFLILIAFYLVMVIAKRIHPVFRWCDYQTLIQVTDNPQLPQNFENELSLNINGSIITPLLVLKSILIQQERGLVLTQFVDYIKQKNTEPYLERFPSTVPNHPDIVLPELWKHAASLAGYLAGMGSYHLHDGGHLHTTLLPAFITADGKVDKLTLTNLAFVENSVQHGLQILENNPQNQHIQLLIYDVYRNLPSRRSDAICIEIYVYSDEQPLRLKLIIPYCIKTDASPFKLQSVLIDKQTFVMRHKHEQQAKEAFVARFYEGAFGFETEVTGKLWLHCFENSELEQTDNTLLDTEALTQFSQQFKDIFVAKAVDSRCFSDIVIADCIQQLPIKYRPYLQVYPDWLTEQDELYRQIKAMSNLYKKGKVVWGALIQANKLMFDINEPTANCPGEVIFDPTGQTDVDTLRQMAHQLFLLKNSSPTEPDQQAYAQHLKNEKTRVFNMLFPKSIAPLNLRMSTTWFWRLHLPNGALSLGYFPILVCEEGNGEVMVLPSYFWPIKFKNDWIDAAVESQGGFANLEKSVFDKLDTGEIYAPKDLLPPLTSLFESPKASMSTQKTENDSTLLSDVEKNIVRSLELFEQGLDILNNKNNLSQQDISKALSLLQQASQRGNTKAMMTLFRMYYDGYAVPQDRDKAYKLALNAAQRGDADGCFAVYGFLYHPENKDNSEAIKWLKKASQLGLKPADEVLKDVLQQEQPKVANNVVSDTESNTELKNFIKANLLVAGVVLIILWLILK